MHNQSASGSTSGFKKVALIAGIAGAVILAIVIITTGSLSQKKKIGETVDSGESTLQVVHNIHREFAALQEQDENYAVMLGSTEINMDSADRVILDAERKFSVYLDNTGQSLSSFSPADRSLVDSLISNFRLAIINRQYLSGIRSKLNDKDVFISPRQGAVEKLKLMLFEKDRQLQQLSGRDVNPAKTIKTNRRDSLARMLDEEESRSTGLLDIVNDLKAEVASLRARNNLLQSDQRKSVDIARYHDLQREIEEISAELYLAKVDCNLTRVDADKIVSTSRQRKQLLSDALQVLDNMSQSDNEMIKAKALEKRQYLQEVSAKIRE